MEIWQKFVFVVEWRMAAQPPDSIVGGNSFEAENGKGNIFFVYKSILIFTLEKRVISGQERWEITDLFGDLKR